MAERSREAYSMRNPSCCLRSWNRAGSFSNPRKQTCVRQSYYALRIEARQPLRVLLPLRGGSLAPARRWCTWHAGGNVPLRTQFFELPLFGKIDEHIYSADKRAIFRHGSPLWLASGAYDATISREQIPAAIAPKHRSAAHRSRRDAFPERKCPLPHSRLRPRFQLGKTWYGTRLWSAKREFARNLEPGE